MSYRVTSYSPRFKDQIAVLRSRVFGGTKGFSIRYFEWKYEQNPYIKEPLFCIALLEESVVGMAGAYGTQWRGGRSQNSWIIPCGGELAVDPDHRRHGLGQLLIDNVWDDATKKGYRYALHLGANPSSLRLKTKHQFECLATYKSFKRDNLRTLLARGRQKLKSLIGDRRIEEPFRDFDIWASRRSGSICGALEPRISEMSELVSRCCTNSAARHVRDKSFYRWRFADPRSVYRFVFCEQGGSIEGFLVLHQFPSGGCTTIIDWEASTQGVWSELLQAAVESNPHRLMITSPAFSQEHAQALLRMGFESVSERQSVTNLARGIYLRELAFGGTANGGLDLCRSPSPNRLDVRMICSDAF